MPTDFPQLAAVPMILAAAGGVVLGVCAIVAACRLWRRSFSTRWKNAFAAQASASPWCAGDLWFLLGAVAAGQLLRMALPRAWSSSLFLQILCAHGVWLAAGILLARGKAAPWGERLPIWSAVREGLFRWLAILPVLWIASVLALLGLRACGVAPAFQPAVEMFLQAGVFGRLGMVLLTVTVVPAAEELLFREVLQPICVRAVGAAAGLTMVTFLFALLHGDVRVVVPVAVLSAALSFARVRSGSLTVCIVMHALFNGVNLLALALLHAAGGSI